jgi:DNA replication and repair protein RecF
MYVHALLLRNFRLFEEAQFSFSPGLNVIQGANAQGKTSIIEALCFLMTGRSFRTAQTNALVRQGASHFYLEAEFVKYGISQLLKIHSNGRESKLTYNSSPISGKGLLGVLQGTVMHPDDVSAIKGPPALRRQILNMQLAQLDPLYVHYLTRYEQAMRQRNALLRAQRTDAIESWEYEMGNAAAYLVQKRASIISQLEHSGKGHYAEICRGAEEFSLLYKPHGLSSFEQAGQEEMCQLFCAQYRKQRKREMALGITLTGPHKDDFSILLGGQDTRLFASEGQQRSCIAALRLAEWTQLHEASKEMPLMLVDDFGIGLDSSRRSALAGHLQCAEQAFITATEPSGIPCETHTIKL